MEANFFICVQNFLICEVFFINSASYYYCRGSYGPPYKSGKIICIFPSALIFLVNVTPIKWTRASSYIKGRVSGELWWWTKSEISKNHWFSCSPSASTRTTCPFTLKFCTEFQETLLYKRVPAFFVIVSSSLVLKESVWSTTTHFYEKYIKIDYFKTNEA